MCNDIGFTCIGALFHTNDNPIVTASICNRQCENKWMAHMNCICIVFELRMHLGTHRWAWQAKYLKKWLPLWITNINHIFVKWRKEAKKTEKERNK